MTQNLSALIARIVNGDPGAKNVLKDLLLESGAPEHAAAAFINAIGLGPELTDPYFASRLPSIGSGSLLADATRPFVLYDTVPVQWGGTPFFCQFQWPMGRMKTDAECNFTQTRRLPSYCAMALRRVSIELPPNFDVPGRIMLLIGSRQVVELPLSDLRLRSVFGFPVVEEFNDRDDIRAWVDLYNDGSAQLPEDAVIKLKLHGLLRAPVK